MLLFNKTLVNLFEETLDTRNFEIRIRIRRFSKYEYTMLELSIGFSYQYILEGKDDPIHQYI